jgi:RNA polymerase sigma-70 factor (ECF subfamily)
MIPNQRTRGNSASTRLTDDCRSDEALMSAVAASDMSALGRLVVCHQDRVLRLAQRITGDADLAEDIAQETFLRVFRAAKRYQPSAKFTTWLHRVVVNLCWDHRRKWQSVEGPREPREGQPFDPAARLSQIETRMAVRRAVAALPPRQRMAVVLHRFEGHRMEDVAEITGWSNSAVESCLVRAYRQLRKELATLNVPFRQRETAG